MAISLRPALPGDEEFLFSVYASTGADEMALVDWNKTQKESFLRMQFNSQDQFYKANYPSAEYQLILLSGHPARVPTTHDLVQLIFEDPRAQEGNSK